ncbi:MAG: GAF domain-containing sensor histidine kinase [Ardenticatenaceae bacterium]|nr:GAF domain-containing sensor histidine kinase [Ardenticatenaceae bacterium]
MREIDSEDSPLALLLVMLRFCVANNYDPAAVGRHALSLILESLSILRGEIYFLDEVGQLKPLALAGYAEASLSSFEMQVEQRMQQQLIRQVLGSGRGVTIPDINCQEDWLPIPGLDEDVCSVAVLPLKSENDILGVISLLSAETGYFTKERLPLLTAVAATVAIALYVAKLFNEVQTGQQQLRLLTDQLINAQEMERKRVSRTLHDETGQTLTVLQMRLKSIQSELPPASSLGTQMEEAYNLLTETITRIRRLTYNLRPPELDTLGLNSAMETLCREFDKQADIQVDYQGSTDIPRLSDSVNIAFYRCLQEALTNVAKHAQATHIEVQFYRDGDNVHLQVKDDGRGLQAAMAHPDGRDPEHIGLGLIGMKERFDRINGHLILMSGDGEGTTLTAVVPWQSNMQAATGQEFT